MITYAIYADASSASREMDATQHELEDAANWNDPDTAGLATSVRQAQPRGFVYPALLVNGTTTVSDPMLSPMYPTTGILSSSFCLVQTGNVLIATRRTWPRPPSRICKPSPPASPPARASNSTSRSRRCRRVARN